MPDEAAGRVDKALARAFPEIPGWQLRKAFSRRDVRLNGQRVAADAKASPGDALCVYLPEALPPALDIVWQDEAYVVVNKRQGMPVQGTGSVESAYERIAGTKVFACHRLDVQTGGLLLLAKHPAALETAEKAFAEHALEKTYQAVVVGVPEPAQATLHAYLRKDADAATVRIFDVPRSGALPIETRYRTLAEEGDTSLLEIRLITGRTHQIRAHLAHIGHPVLGDDKYGDRGANRAHGARRQMLWATRLALWDGRAFEVQAGWRKHDSTDRI